MWTPNVVSQMMPCFHSMLMICGLLLLLNLLFSWVFCEKCGLSNFVGSLFISNYFPLWYHICRNIWEIIIVDLKRDWKLVASVTYDLLMYRCLFLFEIIELENGLTGSCLLK